MVLLENTLNCQLPVKNRMTFYLATCRPLSVLNILGSLVLECLRLKFYTYVGRSKQRYEMRYAVFRVFIWQILHLFFCYISFLSCLVFSIVMINIESVNATENCLLNILSVRFFLPAELFFTYRITYTYSHLVKTKEFRYNLNKYVV